MGIILIELIVIFSIVKRLKKQNINLINTVVLGLIIQSLILIIYRLNLDSLGRIVYYSDAEEYWFNTLQLLSIGRVIGKGTQVGYAYFSALIQILSPFRSVIWNNISNILLVDLSILCIDTLLVQYEVVTKNIRSFTRLCIYNPLIIYSLGRNLKDALFLFITVLIIVLYTQIKQEKKWICIIPIILLTIAVSTIRPWGFLVMPLLAIDGILSSELGSPLKRGFVAFSIFITFFMLLRFTSLWNHVIMWEPIVMERAGTLSISERIKAPIKILTGPGPYRAFMGHKFFLFYTSSGNIFCGIGALLWWMFLSVLISNITAFELRSQNITLALVCILFILIYSMQYGGSLEVRFRGVIYILFSSAFFIGLKREVHITLWTVIIFLMMLPVGTILSS